MSVHAPPLRVLAVHRYYWPDTPPYASMLRDIVAQWSADGVDVEVMTSQPSYKAGSRAPRQPRHGRVDGRVVHRVTLPLEHGRRRLVPLNAAIFSVLVALRILFVRRAYDVVMTSTAPPVLLAWVCACAARARGSRFVYHCMDIHPEIGQVSGEFKHPLVFRTLQRLDRATCESAAAVVVLSDDMARTLQQRATGRRLAVRVVNNFELGEKRLALAPPHPTSDGRLRVVFTGNIGRFQGLETVFDALGLLAHAKVDLTLMGEGSAVEGLRERAETLPGASVTFVPHGDVAAARRLIATADLGLVSLTGGIQRFAYPSKTMTYLAEGCPILAVVEHDCELAGLLGRAGLGVSSPPADAQALADVLDELAGDEQRLARLRTTARRDGPTVFDKPRILQQWSLLLAEITAEGRAHGPT